MREGRKGKKREKKREEKEKGKYYNKVRLRGGKSGNLTSPD